VTWLLDTNVISEPTKRFPSPEVMGWVAKQPVTTLYTTSLAFAEIRAGVERVSEPARRTEMARWLDFRVRPLFGSRVIDADESVWTAMLQILARVKASNRTVPVTDLVFAAAAERHQFVVVTRNVKHFAQTGVRVLNPWLASPTAGLVRE
jgi:predicted nucleic acid-binding protein